MSNNYRISIVYPYVEYVLLFRVKQFDWCRLSPVQEDGDAGIWHCSLTFRKGVCKWVAVKLIVDIVYPTRAPLLHRLALHFLSFFHTHFVNHGYKFSRKVINLNPPQVEYTSSLHVPSPLYAAVLSTDDGGGWRSLSLVFGWRRGTAEWYFRW